MENILREPFPSLSQAPKTEGGLPARLFRNGLSPPKSEEAGKDLSACTAQADAGTTLSIHLLSFLPRDFRMSEGYNQPFVMKLIFMKSPLLRNEPNR